MVIFRAAVATCRQPCGRLIWRLGRLSGRQSLVRFFLCVVCSNESTDIASKQCTLTLKSWTFKFFVLIQITMETGASEEFSKMATPLWQPDTLTASRAGVSSSTTRAAPWSGPSTWRETWNLPRPSTSKAWPREPGWRPPFTHSWWIILFEQIRADPVHGGYVVASTAWSGNCPDDDQNIRIVKFDSSLNVEWSEEFGECDGSDQLFDFVVDRWELQLWKHFESLINSQQRRHCHWWPHSCWRR